MAEAAAKANKAGCRCASASTPARSPIFPRAQRENPSRHVTAAARARGAHGAVGFEDFKALIKSTNVPNTIASNRLLGREDPRPAPPRHHLGRDQVVRLAQVVGGPRTPLADGIGDTSASPCRPSTRRRRSRSLGDPQGAEVRERGPVLIVPDLRRLSSTWTGSVAEIEQRLRENEEPTEVPVLGCAVNGSARRRTPTAGSPAPRTRADPREESRCARCPQDELVEALSPRSTSRSTRRRSGGPAEGRRGAAWPRRSRRRTPVSRPRSGSRRWVPRLIRGSAR